MPIPNPNKKELKENDKDAFIARCAETMAEQDPNTPQKQRLGICYNSWDKAKEKQRKKNVEKTPLEKLEERL